MDDLFDIAYTNSLNMIDNYIYYLQLLNKSNKKHILQLDGEFLLFFQRQMALRVMS